MKHHRTAAVLSVGDELTLGQTLDTNSQWLARRLLDLGIVTRTHITVSDQLTDQVGAIKSLSAYHDLIIVSGGLGPTDDDLTRDALAGACDDELIQDPIALSQIESWFTSRNREMPEINRRQALRPKRGVSLQNLNGTAPGLYYNITYSDHMSDVFCLPGPPREMVPMFEQQVVPRLHPDKTHAVHTRVLHCFGIGESDLATRLGPLMSRNRNPLVGTTASGGVVSMRIRYEGNFDDTAARALHETETLCRAAAGPYLFGEAELTFQHAIIQLLAANGHTLSCVESCTGGLLSSLLTEVPGASSVFAGGLLTYSNELKQRLAQVPPAYFEPSGPGAVSHQTALAMANGGLAVTNATHCIAITGIAGPGGGTKEKPVGTVWISLASSDRTHQSRRFILSGDRSQIRLWAAMFALAMLRQKLLSIDAPLMREQERL